jgi:sialate O-acetylesterase
LIRVFDTDYTPSDNILNAVGGKWEITSPETVGHFSAAAYFFARELYNKYKVPIGLVTTAYGASTAEAWVSKKTLEANPLFAKLLSEYEKKKTVYDTSITAQQKYAAAYEKFKVDSVAAKLAKKDPPRNPKNPDPKIDQHNPYVLYNGMIAPLVPYAIKGAIWYQGESNGPSKEIYAAIMEALIKNWRQDFAQGDFPFIYVQLANNGKALDTIAGKGGNTTIVREQQLKNLAIKNTAMVVAVDNADDPSNIHPKNKQQIGLRLALAAKAKVYGEKIPYSGPIYNAMKIEGNTIRISFNHLEGGLTIKGDKPIGFAIAGADKKFVWATATIDGANIIVSSPDIIAPVAVRYAWGDNPPANLYNKAELPASPFRTDDW